MALIQSHIESHWNYFLAIENDLEQLARFVEFTQDNYSCYSLEIARILMAASAEVDVVCKQLAVVISQSAANQISQPDNIHRYRDVISPRYPKIQRFTVEIPRYGLKLHPWDEWSNPNGVPIWWTGYNKTKHERHSEYRQANLKNALNSVAGLFVMVLYLYRDKAENAELKPQQKFLKAGSEFVGSLECDGYDFAHHYHLGGA
jgi:hypothetical protein